MRLKLIDQIYNQKLSFDNLKANGLNAAPQGPVKTKQNLLTYINSNFYCVILTHLIVWYNLFKTSLETMKIK